MSSSRALSWSPSMGSRSLREAPSGHLGGWSVGNHEAWDAPAGVSFGGAAGRLRAPFLQGFRELLVLLRVLLQGHLVLVRLDRLPQRAGARLAPERVSVDAAAGRGCEV